MHYADRAFDYLDGQSVWGYHPNSQPAAEPTALAAMALASGGRTKSCQRALAWLAAAQGADGSVPIRLGVPVPGWPTALAALAWKLSDPVGDTWREPGRRAIDWLLSTVGESSARQPYTGHDTRLVGWPWVIGTHSWVEPTAAGVLALKAIGQAQHPRTREAVRLLTDRLLPDGGCNYGNTIVLDQVLLPHVVPTGAALLALAGEADVSGGVAKSIAYLERTLGPQTTSMSLAYGLLGLAAHGRFPRESADWISSAIEKSYRRGSSFELSLLVLAALGADCPLISLAARPVSV